jgi:hypothetical protein
LEQNMVSADPNVTTLELMRAHAYERLRDVQIDIDVKQACGRGLSAPDARERASSLAHIAELDAAISRAGGADR